jgi:streptogramin lyase
MLLLLVLASAASASSGGERVRGRVHDGEGNPVVGAMVTFQRGEPAHRVTVFSDRQGRFATPPLSTPGEAIIQVRRIGWKDLRREGVALADDQWFDLPMERETDPAKVAEQLPANRWYALVLEKVEDPAQREELVRQCTYCHQQGSWATRKVRDPEEWQKVLALMGRMGGLVSRDLRERLPELFNEAYAPEHAVAELTAELGEGGFAPPPPVVRKAVIDEWDLGSRASMQHDMLVHPDGRIYSVDMAQDSLYRLDPRDGTRESWVIPDGGLPIGGVFVSAGPPDVPTSNAHVGPHSLQVAPDGAVWITLALGNQLARFDPETGTFTTHEMESGYYPHTLRFDARGRIWYTIAASNHLGMYDPSTGEGRQLRLPSRTLGQAVAMRMMPLLMWVGRYVDLRGAAADGDGFTAPIPYGVDVAPDGTVWFSQLNEHRIGRVDPDTFEIEMIDTPFTGPRRMRFDSRGGLWIPGFSSNLIARFDPETREFEEFTIPVEPLGSETPYALHVNRKNDDVWICGTNSDSLIRFEPRSRRFTVYPLPTRVTYTREIDFDAEGRVWTSNSNAPAWQIEGGMPRVVRLDPRGDVALAAGR